MKAASRFKVLVVAYACDPGRGSESGVGWNWVRNIAERHETVVVTADFNREAIERHLEADATLRPGNLRFAYVPNRKWHYRPKGSWLKVEASALKPLMNLAYQDWLKCALRVTLQQAAAEHFDLIHLVTYVGFRFPGRFWTIGLPFVWGPIGGMENTPWRLLPIMGPGGALFYACRNVINSIQLRILPGPKAAFAASHGRLIAATPGIQKAIRRHYGMPSTVICEVGPPEIPLGEPSLRHPGDALVISWSGAHLPGKALPLLLRAVATLPPHIDWRLEILGDGPCRRAWQSLALRLGVGRRCRWHGWLPRRNCLDVMNKSHVFAMTSLKDLTSTVCMEALSAGLPLVCLDHCGFGELVTPDCGIRVPLGSARQMQRGLANAIERLWGDETERRRLSNGALARCKEYSWQRKLECLDTIYSAAVEKIEHERPDLCGSRA